MPQGLPRDLPHAVPNPLPNSVPADEGLTTSQRLSLYSAEVQLHIAKTLDSIRAAFERSLDPEPGCCGSYYR
jgi:hypothetical protein